MTSPTPPSKERTPQDYAIEHAEYMATDAERLNDAVNDLALAEAELEDGTANESDVDAAREAVSEAQRALRSGVYEFRKRRDRAASAAPAPSVGAEERLAILRGAFRSAYGYEPDPAAEEDVEDFAIFCAGAGAAAPSMPAVQAVIPPDCTPQEWQIAVNTVYNLARTSSVAEGIPSHVLQAMRDHLRRASMGNPGGMASGGGE